MDEEIALAESAIIEIGSGRIVACCVLQDAHGWHVFAELERRSHHDRRANEVPPMDALELFWRADRTGPERRQAASLSQQIEIDDPDLQSELRQRLQATWGNKWRQVKFFVAHSLPRSGDGTIARQVIEARFGASRG